VLLDQGKKINLNKNKRAKTAVNSTKNHTKTPIMAQRYFTRPKNKV
jgi:hypothetical protein